MSELSSPTYLSLNKLSVNPSLQLPSQGDENKQSLTQDNFIKRCANYKQLLDDRHEEIKNSASIFYDSHCHCQSHLPNLKDKKEDNNLYTFSSYTTKPSDIDKYDRDDKRRESLGIGIHPWFVDASYIEELLPFIDMEMEERATVPTEENDEYFVIFLGKITTLIYNIIDSFYDEGGDISTKLPCSTSWLHSFIFNLLNNSQL